MEKHLSKIPLSRWSQLAFHIVSAKPSEASHGQRGAYDKASDQSRVTNAARHSYQENPVPL